MKKCLIVVMLLGAVVAVRAEITNPYEWEKNRARYALTPAEQGQSEIILKQHSQYEYVLDDKTFLMYATVHRIVLVNNNEAIQKHNRIVISMNNTLELVELKARAINKEGKAVYFDKSNLKELKEEESGNAYRIFAIEGIELGSEVEYYFIRKMQPSFFERSFLQFDVPIKSSSFELTCPPHLKFDFKTYNGFPEVKAKEGEDKNVYTATMADVPAIKEEPFSYLSANRKRIEFKLAYNTARSQARLYTWDDAAKTFFSVLTTVTKDDEKAVDKFLKTVSDNSSLAQEDRIRNIEKKIKTTVQVNSERGDESLTQMESVLKYKLASREGMTKLFISTFNKLNIRCYPVITCSRKSIKFDGAFDSWGFLDDYLLYFPDTRGFLAPYVPETHYPLVPPDFTAQQGLFIEPFTVGEVRSALGTIQEIPAADFQMNTDNLDMDVTFSDDLTSARIHQKREFGGYNANSFTLYYDMMTEDQRKQMIEELTKETAPDASIQTWKASSVPGKKAGNFLIDADFQSVHFLEKAGPRILFKAGELIGPQVEMYRDDQRITDVENEYNRGYDRKIRIHLPAGYTIKNPGDLKFDVTYQDKNETPFLFQSSYALKDDVLEISIIEYYKQIHAPLSRYEDYRKVINAAADFNKVTLVLEKK